MKIQAAPWLSFVLAGLAACAGEIDPSLIPGAGNPLGQGGSGGGATPCDAPKMVFAASCGIPGCHGASSAGGAGLDLASAGVAGRLLGQGPSTKTEAGAVCADAGKPYLVAGSNPGTGLLMDKMDATKLTCGNSMALVSGITSTQLTCLSAWATGVTTGTVTQ